MATVPYQPPKNRLNEKDKILLANAQRDSDVSGLNVFPVPKLITTDNTEIVGRHPNKAAFIIVGDSPNYQSKSEINLVAGALGSAQTALDPNTGEPTTYQFPLKADAASVVISEATDESGIVSLVGKPNFRSAVRAKADVIKLHAREVLELSAGGENYMANGSKIQSPYGAVHIIAGNKVDDGDFSLQPMVKGDNLKQFLDEMAETVANMNSNQQKIIEQIMVIQVVLSGLLTVVSAIPGAAAGTAPLITKLSQDIVQTGINLCNNLGGGVNNELRKINYNQPFSPKAILSKFNKVN